MADVNQRVRTAILLDAYAPLLTQHRQELMRLYSEEDLSLAEIAEQENVSRQAVSDLLNKTRLQLEEYEEKLHWIHDAQRRREKLNECKLLLEQSRDDSSCRAVMEIIEELLQEG